MRHRKKGSKLGRNGTHRRALLRNMATALFEHEHINTTAGKARELRSFAEKLITLAKRGDLHARRLAQKHIGDRDILRKLFDDIGPRFAERDGGYTRILKTNFRRGDNAPMAFIELVDRKTASEAASDDSDALVDADAQ